jgi:hypothetical protein
MNDIAARRQACSEWLLEFSVLWAVFPLLDQLLRDEPIDLVITALSVAISWMAFSGGILLRKGEPT